MIVARELDIRIVDTISVKSYNHQTQNEPVVIKSPDMDVVGDGTGVLIVDDLGLRPLRHEEPEDLHDIIRGRYERHATILTSNRDVTEWPSMFGDPLMASAAMDRLLHHAHVVVLEGDSFRNPTRERAA